MKTPGGPPPRSGGHGQVDATGTTIYVGTLYEKNVSTGVETSYYFAGSSRIAMRKGGVLSYLAADHLGSTSLTMDASGNKTGEMKYKPFGETRYTWGSTPTDRKFTGQRQEDSSLGSLYDYGARFYSPVLGRFLSADTMVPHPENPQNWNRYTYSGNNPLRYIDPSGHSLKDVTDGGAGLGGYVGGSGGSDQMAMIAIAAIVSIATVVSAGAAIEYGPAIIEGAGTLISNGLSKAGEILGLCAVTHCTEKAEEAIKACGGDCSDEAGSAVKLLQGASDAGKEIIPRLLQGTSKWGLDHIALRHWFSTGIQNVSKFASDIGIRELKEMISQAAGNVSLWTQEGNSWVRVIDAGRIIGTDLANNATNFVKIVVDQTGRVITTYPVSAP